MNQKEDDFNIEPPTAEELIEAGIDLIQQSLLAKRTKDGLLCASNEGDFEAAVHAGGYQQRRLDSWILFTTGAEYIVKGVCLEFGIGTMKPNRNTGEPDIGTLTPYFKGDTHTSTRLRKLPVFLTLVQI